MKFILALLCFSGIVLLKASAQTTEQPANPPDTLAIANKGMPAGMDIYIMAEVATRHHCPLPGDVLACKKQLGIDAAQLTRLNAIVKVLNLKKLEISQSVRLNENTLNQMFAARRLNDGALIFYGNRFGLYHGEMRTAVLTACYQTAQVLTPGQIARFEQIKKPY